MAGKPGSTSSGTFFTSGLWVLFVLLALLFGNGILAYVVYHIFFGNGEPVMAFLAYKSGFPEIMLWCFAIAAIIIDILMFFFKESKSQSKK
ncbi:MAG: hypothetical protein R8L53_05380 [Mariprofundales bacterium]